MQEKSTVELCAIAAGYVYKGKVGERTYVYDPITENELDWNPCLKNGDAFDLMVRANIQVNQVGPKLVCGIGFYSNVCEDTEWMNQDKRWRSCICKIACEKVIPTIIEDLP